MSFSHQPIMQMEIIDNRDTDNRIRETLKNKGKQPMERLELSTEHVLREEDEIGIVERGVEHLVPSAQKNIETLWKYLDDDTVGTIGLAGVGGIGKRWTVSHVVERAVAANRFDSIIWVILQSRSDADYPRPMLVQITDQLKLRSTTRESEEGIKVSNSELRERISKTLAEKSYLMILCDIQHYSGNALSTLGVPHPNTQSKRSKLLFLGARYWFSENRVDRVLTLTNLPKDEAWLLFCEKTGSQFDSLGIRELAETLLKSCEGLPLKIVTLAGALRNVNEPTSPRLMVNVQEANKLIVNRSMYHYEAMYKMLPSKEAKECIVYCSSYPLYYRISVEGLITSWIAEGLLDKLNGLKAAHEKAQEILKELIDRHLLIRYDDSHVMMNYDIRLCFSSMVFLLLEKSGWSMRLTVPELLTEHESFRKISILNENFESKYPHNATVSSAKSSTLLLYGKEGCLPDEIPGAFFEKMNHLQFLSILHAGIRYLPSSLSSLKNLGALVVRGCFALTNVDTIRELHSLVVLNLSGASSLKELPDDFFEHMQLLKNLNLSETQLKQLPSSFQNLKYIQRLILRGCSYLETLPHHVEDTLTVVDLSGASSLVEIPNEFIEKQSSLELLDLSGTRLTYPNVIHRDLKYLFLNGCSRIKTLPHPEAFVKLQELDLSGASEFKEFQYVSSSSNSSITKIDLSKTQIVKIPSASKYPNLQQLCLKSCEYLEELPHLELRKLEVLDLSGSTNFKRFQDDSFANMRRLQILNLSSTRVEKLPTLAECSLLCQLLLRDCTKLEKVPHMEAHKTLEVLDLSGSTSFMEFQDQSFQQMDELEIVNLSGSHIEKLPSFSKCPKLRQLLLKGCAYLQELPHLELERLEVLNLSGTQVAKLPDLTKYCFLRELLLRCCTKLVTIPHLESLERLEVLDLSGATSFKKFQYKSLEDNFSIFSQCIACIPKLHKVDLTTSPLQISPISLPELQNLPQLFLRGCSRLLLQPDPEIPTKFEVLDFSCMQIRDFPDGSSKWTDLRFLGMLNQKFLWDFDWGKTEEVTKQMKFDSCKSDDAGITSIRIISSDIKLFHFMKTSSELWKNYFQKFHYCLCSPKEWEKEKDIYLHQRRVVFKDIFYPTSQIPHSTAPDHVFEICGFSEFPTIIDEDLSQVKILYLKKNSFITRLSDLGAIRECWIERCDSIEYAFYGEEKEENVAFGRVLENIWVSNLSKLRSLFSGGMKPMSFKCLKHLSIDCCPCLVTVFSSHLELVNLETLKIKFCDKVENIFGESESGEQILPKLNTLTLWRLPELQNICGGELPSLRNVRVKGCSKLLKLPVGANNASSVINIRGELIWWNNLVWEDKGIMSRLSFTELHRFL
ncbi:Disease resistance protein [Thalictrum thalictroides]|uniref:Disease resistance protein n=1 Tax=Thalictrum thalictroides TaxID=46969 RepID=A0A7J6V9S7_THATH|nr:Disease resistance protein [Thalictrum thalictroides]